MAAQIEALVLDVDGVLTDGGIILDSGGREAKRFHARDGVGIRLALLTGWRVLFLTARASIPVKNRAQELGAEWAIGIGRKELFLQEWLEGMGIAWDRTAFVGDDLQDLAVMRRVGWPVAVADAVDEVKTVAKYITTRPGGAGAVREAVEWLLSQAGLREEALLKFMSQDDGFSMGKSEHSGAAKPPKKP
jgi:3-deoxy-D-manno-octulosonate 8-phosphate phosphatase (KDO 8-P phosphatase)